MYEYIFFKCTTCTLTVYEFILCVNSYIQPNFSTAEAADIDLAAAAADDSFTTYAAYSASGVSILDDSKGNIKAVLGEKKSDVVEASAPAAATVVVAVAPATSAAAFSFCSSSSCAGCCFREKRGEWIAVIFCMGSHVLKIHILNEFMYMLVTKPTNFHYR